MPNRTKVVKIAADGLVTLSLSDMAGQYLIVEEGDGQIILSPYDLRWSPPASSIARHGASFYFVSGEGETPRTA